jgi:hypothetical protein
LGNVVIDMSMSLDGYIAAPNDTPEQGLGEDGMRLHNWMFDDPTVFERVSGDLTESTGAVIMGADTDQQSWPPPSWTRSGSTWSMSCSAAAVGCSTSSPSGSISD